MKTGNIDIIDLKQLLIEVDKLFPKRKKPYLTCYNYTLGKFPYGWVFSVVNSWQNWSNNNLQHKFGAYEQPEYAVHAFLNYVKENKINVKKLIEH